MSPSVREISSLNISEEEIVSISFLMAEWYFEGIFGYGVVYRRELVVCGREDDWVIQECMWCVYVTKVFGKDEVVIFVLDNLVRVVILAVDFFGMGVGE